jgi:glycosyltransferase involved in cell wall biosynthesis
MAADSSERLRVALVAGTLGVGGAEKQLVYLARALLSLGAEVRIYSLTRGEFHEAGLQAIGVQPIWIGQHGHSLLRLAVLLRQLRRFRPHIIQSTHSFVNLYAGLAGRLLGVTSLGAMRGSFKHVRSEHVFWGRWLVTVPSALLTNSQTALAEVAESQLIDSRRVALLPNAIDVDEFNQPSSSRDRAYQTAIFVGRLIALKRPDLFVRALALARRQHSTLKGIVVGDGPQRSALEELAAEFGLGPGQLTFFGWRDDVPELLRQADMLVLCSEDAREGLPNVLLEAMAASLPVIATPAGDARFVVQDGETGYVVPFNDVERLGERMVRLAQATDLRCRLGAAGRAGVDQYRLEHLAARVVAAYEYVAQQQQNRRLLRLLPAA